VVDDDDTDKKKISLGEGLNSAGMAAISHSGSSNSAVGNPRRGMVLPFQPLSLAFDHINYYVDMPAVSYSFFRLCDELYCRWIFQMRI